MSNTVIKIEHLSKMYQLGVINNGVLFRDIQSWWALKRGKEDPHSQIGEDKCLDSNTEFWALKDLTFDIKQGDRVGIIGRNGAGKSTLLKVLSRITTPTEGSVKIRGKISSLLEVGTGFHGELTGRENIYLNGAILGMKKREIDRKLDEIIDFSGIEKHIDTPVKRYSSGMYVRLAFAVAAHLDSDILIADEVLAVGDAEFQKKAIGKMGDLSTSEGRTILFVSHNMTSIRSLCSRCVVLNRGKIFFNGSVDEAISAHMDQSHGDLLIDYEFNKSEINHPYLGKKIFIKKLEFTEKQKPIYDSKEKMKIKIYWESYLKSEGIRCRIEIHSLDDSIVGMMESSPFLSVDGVSEGESVFSVDLRNLTAGEYYFRLSFFTLNSLGIHTGVSDTPRKIFFKVFDSVTNRTGWLRQYWGYVRLPDIEVL